MNQLLASSELWEKLITLVEHADTAVQIAALRVLGNFITVPNGMKQVAPLMLVLERLLNSSKSCVTRETCWCLSNIAAGTREQVEALMASDLVVPQLVRLLGGNDMDARKEACWCLCNLITGRVPTFVRRIVSQDCVGPLLAMLDCNDTQLMCIVLDALQVVLCVGETLAGSGGNPFVPLVQAENGEYVLTRLLDHDCDEIWPKASALLDAYFGAASADEDDAEGTGGQPDPCAVAGKT
eukprot:TRINITY_DN11522_c0_g1_i1.p1 TRINITY_DN11522_c0_g1~~TRINITY_DN11522_c0_g1_i1.p1  ORF type:complete len:239 (+),score=60.99 TRINITY_DN11522_c0_g1_i1:928-1644(+)